MQDNTILQEYTEFHRELNELNKKCKELKTKIKNMEPSVFEIMSTLNADSLSYKNATINQVQRKISKKFKKETIEQKVIDNIGQSDTSTKLVESLLTDEPCETETKLRVKIK